MKITKSQLKQIIKEEISSVPQLMDDVALDISTVLGKQKYLEMDFGNFEIADQIAKALEQVAKDIRDNARAWTRS